jgi:hypothetical protein
VCSNGNCEVCGSIAAGSVILGAWLDIACNMRAGDVVRIEQQILAIPLGFCESKVYGVISGLVPRIPVSSATSIRPYNDEWDADNAIDGGDTAGSQCVAVGHHDTTELAWLELQLPGEYEVDRVSIQARTDGWLYELENVQISVCSSGNCEVCGNIAAGSVTLGAWLDIACNMRAGDVVRIEQQILAIPLGFCEVNLYGLSRAANIPTFPPSVPTEPPIEPTQPPPLPIAIRAEGTPAAGSASADVTIDGNEDTDFAAGTCFEATPGSELSIILSAVSHVRKVKYVLRGDDRHVEMKNSEIYSCEGDVCWNCGTSWLTTPGKILTKNCNGVLADRVVVRAGDGPVTICEITFAY